MITNDRQYRNFEFRAEDSGHVEGYACVFDQETVLYEIDGVQYKEVISPDAFRNTQMSDVVMNYNHCGKPVARTKNNTLQLSLDASGLKIVADLSGTAEGRNLMEEIKGGYIDKMSFAFVVDGEAYDRNTHTRTVTSIKRLYDVAAVDIPAYEQTSISARSFFEAEAEKERAEAQIKAAEAVARQEWRKRMEDKLKEIRK